LAIERDLFRVEAKIGNQMQQCLLTKAAKHIDDILNDYHTISCAIERRLHCCAFSAEVVGIV